MVNYRPYSTYPFGEEMMNLQKEREEFEAWHYEQYLIENPSIDIANAKYIYDYAHKNALVCQLKELRFIAWQAAKAKAIPEGFVVVPKVPTQRMLDATFNVPIPAVYVDSISGQHKLKVAAYYKAMIEAVQEANND